MHLIQETVKLVQREYGCVILSRGDFYTFMWDNASKTKIIQHDPTYSIQLMPVNERDDYYMQCFNMYSDEIIDGLYIDIDSA